MTAHGAASHTRRQALSTAAVTLLGLAAIVAIARPYVPDRARVTGRSVIRPPVQVEALAVQNGVVWAGGSEGLVAIDRKAARLLPLPGAPPRFALVTDLVVDQRGMLWIAHQDGVTSFADGRWTTFTDAGGVSLARATALFAERDGALWIGTEHGVVRMRSDGTTRAFTTADGLAAPSVNVIFQDRDGAMWFGSSSPTRGGLTSFDGTTWRTYTTRDGLAHETVTSIAQDRDGGLWFGTGYGTYGGASRLLDGVWTTLRKSDGLAGDRVRSIYADRGGRMWFGSETGGVVIQDGPRLRLLTPFDGLAGWEVMKVLQDEDGVYWLGTEDGVSRVEPDAW